MKRDGYESDRNRLCIMNIATGKQRYLTDDEQGRPTFDSNVDSYCWANDSKSLYFVGTWHGTTQVYNVTTGAHSPSSPTATTTTHR